MGSVTLAQVAGQGLGSRDIGRKMRKERGLWAAELSEKGSVSSPCLLGDMNYCGGPPLREGTPLAWWLGGSEQGPNGVALSQSCHGTSVLLAVLPAADERLVCSSAPARCRRKGSEGIQGRD